MISILFYFCHLKNSTFLHISISKSHHNLTLVVYFNWKVSFETVDMKIIIQQKNRVWEPSEQTKPLPGVLPRPLAMAGNSLGPSVMEAEDSRPLDIMDPLVAEDFQVRRFLGC